MHNLNNVWFALFMAGDFLGIYSLIKFAFTSKKYYSVLEQYYI